MLELTEGTLWMADVDMLVSILAAPEDVISCVALYGDATRPRRVPGTTWAVVKEQCRRRGISKLNGIWLYKGHDWKTTGRLFSNEFSVRIAFPQEFDHERDWGLTREELQAIGQDDGDPSEGRNATNRVSQVDVEYVATKEQLAELSDEDKYHLESQLFTESGWQERAVKDHIDQVVEPPSEGGNAVLHMMDRVDRTPSFSEQARAKLSDGGVWAEILMRSAIPAVLGAATAFAIAKA